MAYSDLGSVFEADMLMATVQEGGGHSLIKKHQDEISGYVDWHGATGFWDYANKLIQDPTTPQPTNPIDPLEIFFAQSQTTPIADAMPGSTNTDRLQQMLSMMVFNPMGRSPEEGGNYGWGDLAYIYQMTPSGDIARQLQSWRAGGHNLKADIAENYYGATKRPDEGLDVIRQLTSKYGHGQTDVAMNPDLVNQMMSRRTTDRSKRQYKGGSVHAGLLTSPALGFKKELGG